MEASQLKWHVSSVGIVKPATGAQAHPESLPLTQFDKEHAYYFPVLFLYRLENSASVYDSLLDRIKTSLAQALVPFYPLAGRVVKGSAESGEEQQILCNDEGVAFVEARVEGRMDDVLFPDGEFQRAPPLSGTDALGINARHPELEWPGVPALIIQVTRFSCGAVAIGVTWHHFCADGEAFTQFLKSWSEICISGQTSIVPVHDRAGLFARLEALKAKEPSTPACQESKSLGVSTDDDVKPLSELSLDPTRPRTNVSAEPLPADDSLVATKAIQESVAEAGQVSPESEPREIEVGSNASTSTSHDSDVNSKSRASSDYEQATAAAANAEQTEKKPCVQDRVYKLKMKWIEDRQKAANASLEGLMSGQLTKVDIMTAHIWRCVARALMAKRKLSISSIWTVVEGRRRLFRPPLSQHYFGNVIVLGWLGTASVADIEDKPLSFSAQLIHNTIHQMKPENSQSTLLPKAELIKRAQMGDDLAGVVGCTSWRRFPVYEIDFGRGKPFWVALNITLGKVKNAVFLPTPPGSTFIPVQLFLMPDIWEAISSDPEFLDAQDKLSTFI